MIKSSDDSPFIAGLIYRTTWLMTVLLTVVLAGVGVLIGFAETHRSDDFWTVAMPGIVTGGGTLILALSTVWLAVSSRLREQLAKIEADRWVADERQRQRNEEAAVEARKVVCWLERNQPQTGVVVHVVNASTQPIVQVYPTQLVLQEHLQGLDNGLPTRYFLPDCNGVVAVILQSTGAALESRLQVDSDAETGTPGPVLYAPDDVQAAIALYQPYVKWTDSHGTKWFRLGENEPEHVPVGA